MLDLYKNIKMRRIELNLSQEQLASKVGYTSRTSIAKIEAGEIDLPQSKIVLFAKALQTTPEWLMGWNRPIDEIDKKGLELHPDFVPGKGYLPTVNDLEKITISELEHLKKYRAIDARGRDMVDTVLEKEYERVQEQEELVGIPLVARSGKNEIIKVTRKELEEINKILDEYEADPDEAADKL